MDVNALILIGGREDGPSYERLGGVPFALLDVLGEPVLGHTLRRLERAGISRAAVVTEVAPSAAPLARGALRPDIAWSTATGPQFWRAAENAFNELTQGAELIVVVRLGPYAEIDYEEVIQCHLDKHRRVSIGCDKDGRSLDTFVISASRRNDAAFLFRHELKGFRDEPESCRLNGYVNWLEHTADFRRLALDSFAGITSIKPVGTEVKPGVWVAEGARVHPKARVLAPAFIGSRCRVRALSVITRGSVLEHHSTVDCGSVVENSTVLPQTCIGAALDVAHSVVGLQRIANLARRVEVEIPDTKLIGTVGSAPARTVSSAVDLAMFLPRAIMRGLNPRARRSEPSSLPEALNTTSAALNVGDLEAEAPGKREFSTNFVVARRYGNE